jgi:protein-S-isoprenylcysteine O-methyltransferase Ste14
MRAEAIYPGVILVAWLVWLIYWLLSATSAKPTERRESLASRLSHFVPLILGIWLIALAHPTVPWFLLVRVWPPSLFTHWLGVAVMFAGLGFSVWARARLGRNWSATVTVKRQHELIRTGPYAWVRHPIYSGLTLALLGNAISLGEVRGFLGVLVIAAAFTRKLRIEERWMREIFGEEYARYAKEVAALIPGMF